MALDLYTYDSDTDTFVQHSKNGLFNNPAQTTHDGSNGEVVEKKLFLRNDDDTMYYTNLIMQPLPLTKTAVGDINFPEAFVTFKIIVQNEQPTENQWKAVQSGAAVTFSDIGSSAAGDTAYKPFWVYVGIPAGTRVQNINDIALHLEQEESPVA